MKHRQIVTLAVDFDLNKLPPPENWDWSAVGGMLNGTAEIRVLAAGAVQRTETEPLNG